MSEVSAVPAKKSAGWHWRLPLAILLGWVGFVVGAVGADEGYRWAVPVPERIGRGINPQFESKFERWLRDHRDAQLLGAVVGAFTLGVAPQLKLGPGRRSNRAATPGRGTKP